MLLLPERSTIPERLETTNRKPTHSTVTGCDNQAILKPGVGAIKFNEWRACVSGLSGGVDYTASVMSGNGSNKLITFTPAPGMLKRNRVRAKCVVGERDGFTQRADSIIVSIRNDNVLARGSKVCSLRCAQAVEALAEWIKSEADY